MMKETTKRSITLVVAASAFVAAVIVASGCQTVKGLGEDIHYAGEKTEEAIKK
jgi:predicted small secreted protein